jgi:hypothetical protein
MHGEGEKAEERHRDSGWRERQIERQREREKEIKR